MTIKVDVNDLNEDINIRASETAVNIKKKRNKMYRIARQPFNIDLVCGSNVVKEKNSELYGRHLIPKRNAICTNCQAILWLDERTSNSSKKNPIFNFCCSNGKVSVPIPEIPDHYRDFLLSNNDVSRGFLEKIRIYNSSLAFTSTKANLDESILHHNKGTFN